MKKLFLIDPISNNEELNKWIQNNTVKDVLQEGIFPMIIMRRSDTPFEELEELDLYLDLDFHIEILKTIQTYSMEDEKLINEQILNLWESTKIEQNNKPFPFQVFFYDENNFNEEVFNNFKDTLLQKNPKQIFKSSFENMMHLKLMTQITSKPIISTIKFMEFLKIYKPEKYSELIKLPTTKVWFKIKDLKI